MPQKFIVMRDSRYSVLVAIFLLVSFIVKGVVLLYKKMRYIAK